MKYRTTLTDPKGTYDKPQQAFHNDSGKAREWAEVALKAASPEAYVTLWRTVEVEIHVWRQEPKPMAPAQEEARK